jgi:antitoxin component of MazEF toxin-antitoxin module
MTNYRVEIKEDSSGEQFIDLPDDLLEELDLEEGHRVTIEIDSDTGGLILRKVNDE